MVDAPRGWPPDHNIPAEGRGRLFDHGWATVGLGVWTQLALYAFAIVVAWKALKVMSPEFEMRDWVITPDGRQAWVVDIGSATVAVQFRADEMQAYEPTQLTRIGPLDDLSARGRALCAHQGQIALYSPK